MRRDRSVGLPPARRMTLLEWIEQDDGDTTGFTHPARDARTQALHAQIAFDAGRAESGPSDQLAPPPGLRLAPLG